MKIGLRQLKVETWAFLLCIIIVNDCKNVNVYTDRETVYNRYEELRKQYIFTNARKIFKESNNVYIRALIRTLMLDEKISLPKLHKVKAHTDNQYHNLLDKELKIVVKILIELIRLT